MFVFFEYFQYLEMMWFGLLWGCNTWSRGSLGLIKKDTSGGSETNWVLTVRLILCCHVIPHFVVTYSNSTLLLINNNLFNLRDTIYRDKHFCVIKPHKKGKRQNNINFASSKKCNLGSTL